MRIYVVIEYDREKHSWRTRWGTLMLQTEHVRGERRLFYPQWHSDRAGRQPPPLDFDGGWDRRAVWRRIQRWVDANGGEITTKEDEVHPLTIALEAAVPLWIMKVEAWTEDQRVAKAHEVGPILAEKGDRLMYGGKKGEAADLFNQVACGIACLAYAPGGVKVFGMHFEAVPKGARWTAVGVEPLSTIPPVPPPPPPPPEARQRSGKGYSGKGRR
jgi:hypothetical protein